MKIKLFTFVKEAILSFSRALHYINIIFYHKAVKKESILTLIFHFVLQSLKLKLPALKLKSPKY